MHNRLSSVAFPHSNWRAVVEVKKIKQIITNNVGTGGNLNMDKFRQRFYNTEIHQPDGRRSILDDLKCLPTSDSSNQSPSTSIKSIDLPSSTPIVSTSPQ